MPSIETLQEEKVSSEKPNNEIDVKIYDDFANQEAKSVTDVAEIRQMFGEDLKGKVGDEEVFAELSTGEKAVALGIGQKAIHEIAQETEAKIANSMAVYPENDDPAQEIYDNPEDDL